MPVIILGGIMSGKFSPTEAAAVATAYALVIGLFVYHELDLKGIWEAFVNAAKSTGQILIYRCARVALLLGHHRRSDPADRQRHAPG